MMPDYDIAGFLGGVMNVRILGLQVWALLTMSWRGVRGEGKKERTSFGDPLSMALDASIL